jgi:hypothetical protein
MAAYGDVSLIKQKGKPMGGGEGFYDESMPAVTFGIKVHIGK